MWGTDVLRYEKKAFWKFFLSYFGSVAVLILLSGSFYFEDEKKGLLAQEHLSMIEYARLFKSGTLFTDSKEIRHHFVDIQIATFSMNDFKIEKDYFLKYVPYNWDSGFIEIKKSKKSFNEKIEVLTYKIIKYQAVLILSFALLSYFLSRKALEPMQEALKKLDNFSKDLIHDLNTPITSILLNMKLLNKNDEFKDNKALIRIRKSVEDISELHNNLTLLLEENTMMMQMHELSEIVEEVVLTHRKIYTNIDFDIKMGGCKKKVNEYAFKQIVSNLVSNACKYNKKDGYVKIYSNDNTIFIEDGGVGIKNIDKVFNRSYHEHESGHGIGLDIVQRLCEAMDIKISIDSKEGLGTVVGLEFKHYI